MSNDLLMRLLRGEHISVPERKALGAWPHSPFCFAELVAVLAPILRAERWFPYEWRPLPDRIGADDVVVERQAADRFVIRSRASNAWGGLAGQNERVVKTAEEAADAYLRGHLYLPGDLDGWQVLP